MILVAAVVTKVVATQGPSSLSQSHPTKGAEEGNK
jgi:hypothetical protein